MRSSLRCSSGLLSTRSRTQSSAKKGELLLQSLVVPAPPANRTILNTAETHALATNRCTPSAAPRQLARQGITTIASNSAHGLRPASAIAKPMDVNQQLMPLLPAHTTQPLINNKRKICAMLCVCPAHRLSTGLYTLVDLRCRRCSKPLGWQYLRASNLDQKYKEGGALLQLSALTRICPEGAPEQPPHMLHELAALAMQRAREGMELAVQAQQAAVTFGAMPALQPVPATARRPVFTAPSGTTFCPPLI